MLLSTGEQVSVALMAMAIHSLGHKAISLTGGQIGIMTDSTHTKARIRSISTERMQQAAGRRQHRHRRRFSGDRRGSRHHHARPRRQRHDGRGPGRRAEGRSRARSTPTWTASTRPIRGCCPKPAAWRGSATTRCWNWPASGAGVMHNRSIEFAKKYSVPDSRPQQLQRHPGHDDRRRAGMRRTRRCAARP